MWVILIKCGGKEKGRNLKTKLYQNRPSVEVRPTTP
jgi:hypothetical protein